MAKRRRNSRGQFVRSSRSKRPTKRRPARRRRGMGSVYAVKRRGMGALSGDAFMTNVMPLFIGIGVTGGVAFAIRKFVSGTDSSKQAVRKYAPLVGAGSGAIAGLALKWLANDDAALTAVISSAMVGGLLMSGDMMSGSGTHTASGAAVLPPPPESAAAGASGYLGMGAIVPEYGNGMGAIVMTPTARGGRRAGSIGSYGETVNLSGINTKVFGTPGF